MLNIRELKQKSHHNTEEQIILFVASQSGACKIKLLEKRFTRDQILLHCRKSPFLTYDRKREVIKVLLKPKLHKNILSAWQEGLTIEAMVMSLLWENFNLSKESIIKKIAPRCNKLGLDLWEFTNSNKNFNWYKKTVKKYLKAHGRI